MKTDVSALVVLVAAGSSEEASTLARAAVERKLAACAQMLPIRSCFEWQGQVVEEDEYMLLLKSNSAAYAELQSCIHELHSYDVPEIIAVPVVAGTPDYLNWLHEIIAARTAQP